MCIKDYIKQAKRTMNTKLTKKQKTMNCLLGLSGETGEVIDYFKKVEFQGHEYKKDKAIDEIGDVFWYLANLVDSLDLDIEEVLKHNIDKLQNRYPTGFKKKNSIDREV